MSDNSPSQQLTMFFGSWNTPISRGQL